MEDLIDLEEDGFDHIMANELEIGIPDQMSNVVLATGEEIIEADDLVGEFRFHVRGSQDLASRSTGHEECALHNLRERQGNRTGASPRNRHHQ